MFDQKIDILFCPILGTAGQLNTSSCFTLEQQTSLSGSYNVSNVTTWPLSGTGCGFDNCVSFCQNPKDVFNISPNTPGASVASCLSLPILFGSMEREALLPNVTAMLQQTVLRNGSIGAMQNITSGITQCLMDTCAAGRQSETCRKYCSPANLLMTNRIPSLRGTNECLYELCNSGLDALPYANNDIIGIGVFSSLTLQVVILFLISIGFDVVYLLYRKNAGMPNKSHWRLLKQNEVLVSTLVEFHKSQCYFSISMQIASLVYGSSDIALLNAYLLFPLATNCVGPVAYGYYVLYKYGRSSTYITLLTGIAWCLSSIVLWMLFKTMSVPVTRTDQEDFVASLSRSSSCGGYTALNQCTSRKFDNLDSAVFYARVASEAYCPFIWAWSTAFMATIVFVKYGAEPKSWIYKTAIYSQVIQKLKRLRKSQDGLQFKALNLRFDLPGIWVSCSFGVCIVYQLVLLGWVTTLQVFDTRNWSYGQIVAVTVWVPPIAEYIHLMSRGMIEGSNYRLARSLTVSRAAPSDDNSAAQSRDESLGGSGEHAGAHVRLP